MDRLNAFLQKAAQRQDMVFAVFFVLIVGMLILPLPTVLIDVLLAINLTLTLIILISATYLKHALDFSTFPSIILITTIFRVAISVSTTRLILAHGDAGHLIEAFGKFVIGGNVVVGLVVFLIIAIVQFMVITKGAERIAEVSARFTLDAMPGKQMSIDNDLRSGDLTKEDAKKKRTNLELESQFHGAMDGAMRFVKGDAIATIIIVFVNLIGGLTIGVAQRGMSFGEASNLYILLSVGDGLLAQIPAMFIAIAAGIIVTRISTDDSKDLGADVGRQLIAEPKALAVSAGLCVVLGFMPGFPTIVFMVLALILGGGAYLIVKKSNAAAIQERQLLEQPIQAQEQKPEPLTLLMESPGDVLVIAGHQEFLNLFTDETCFNAIIAKKEEFAKIWGFQPPGMTFRYDNTQTIGHYVLYLDGVPVEHLKVDNVAPPEFLNHEQIKQFTNDLNNTRIKYAAELFGVNEANLWMNLAEANSGRLVADVQQMLPFMTIVETMRRLLQDGIGLTPPRLVLEGLLYGAQRAQEPEMLAELARTTLRRQICHAIAGESKAIRAYVLSPDMDDVFRRRNSFEGGGASMQSDEAEVAQFLDNTREALAREEGNKPFAVLTAGDTRRFVRQYFTENGLRIPVLGYGDIAQDYQVQTLGILSSQALETAAA